MASNFCDALDPLDVEIVEKAPESALATLEEEEAGNDLDSDEALEANLRRELVEIARCNGVHDPETLGDILLAANRISDPGAMGLPTAAMASSL